MKFFQKLFGVSELDEDEEPKIKHRIDVDGAAQLAYDVAVEMFGSEDMEERRRAITMLIACTQKHPTFVPAFLSLARVFLALGGDENFKHAFKLSSDAYRLEPDNEEVYGLYAGCHIRRASSAWDSGDLESAYADAKKAMNIEGFADQSFALTRHLSKELDLLEDFATHCVHLGIDPLRDFDLSEVNSTETDKEYGNNIIKLGE